MDNILASLNNEQLEAVSNTEGYVRVIAGAGTGKTKALTHRYAYIVQELGISPNNILCLTFTNKAAFEMKNRIKRMLGSDFDTSFVSTIHAYCVRILREDISKLFYPESFIVLDTADQKKILEEVYDEYNVKLDTASFEAMIEYIKAYKDKLTYLEYFSPNFDMRTLSSDDIKEKIILRYMEKQRKYFGLDFADLINFVIYIFDKYPEIEEKWQERLHYIQVDEFQDITVKEYNLIVRLSAIHKNLFVVGDPDQNIYEWRGSKMNILIDFAENHTPCKTIILNQNYRSTPEILQVANSLIGKNKIRIKKDLITQNKNSAKVEYFHGKSDKTEIQYVIDKIKGHVNSGGSYSDIAILYRSNYVSRFIEQGLVSNNIPYIVYGGIGFYDHSEIKDVLSYLRLVSNGDNLSFMRIINVPRRKIGKKKTDFIRNIAESQNLSYYEALKQNIDNNIFKGSGAREFVNVIENLKDQSNTLSVSELLQRILIETKYEYYIRESGNMDRLDNITEFLRNVVMIENEYGEHLTLNMFLQMISLTRDNDIEEKHDRVRIMTAHTAKGLEFDIVFVVGLSDGIFPAARALEGRKQDALEEERRLFFVALTRARKQLFLTESEGYGLKGNEKLPSRFLSDIDESLLIKIGNAPTRSNVTEAVIKHEMDPDVFSVGTNVSHRVFGEGVIKSLNYSTKTYMVEFAGGSTKPISFNFQGLQKI